MARLSFMKVVEFQHRGLVHLHVVLRADGVGGPADPPPSWLDADVLSDAVRGAVASAHVAVPPAPGSTLSRARWGTQIDVRPLEPADPADAVAIAAYVAKYATKTADGSPWLAHQIRSAAADRAPGIAAARRRPGPHGLDAGRPARTAVLCACGPMPTPSAMPGSSPPRASASRPPSRRCERPASATSGARSTTRSTSTASGASPAGATPTPRPICWPGGSTRRPGKFPSRVPEVFPNQCPSP